MSVLLVVAVAVWLGEEVLGVWVLYEVVVMLDLCGVLFVQVDVVLVVSDVGVVVWMSVMCSNAVDEVWWMMTSG